jgi:FkbH-like protein
MTEKIIDNAMLRYKAQAILFDAQPNRVNLLGLDLPSQDTGTPTIINVWRNHGFEVLQPMIASYAAFRRWQLSFRLGGYDDSFSFQGMQNAAVELLWMDSARLLRHITFPDWLEWLRARLVALRHISSAPVVVATWLQNEDQRFLLRACLEQFPAIYFADMEEICDAFDVPLLDDRSATLTGTPVSNRAQVILARTLACKWLPGAALPPIKAIALDLDNTLHAGVLGEDGVNGVMLTPEHESLQRYIKGLQQCGIFIALVSRNKQPDVQILFEQRTDYPLRWEDFSATEVSWGEKADALQRISQTLRISTDAILFVDDNPGELAAVTQRIGKLHTLYAGPCAELTRLAIEYYPGLWRWKQDADDAKRIFDLKANAERDALALTHADPAEYLRSLQVTLSFYWNELSQIGRLADLCNKTNQFNLALRRFGEAELSQRIKSIDACVASVQLSDRLSDSGIIAVIVAVRRDRKIIVEELCISCRALGRQLENDIILHALRQMPIWRDCSMVEFQVQRGDRNQPALDWLNGAFETSPKMLRGSETCTVPSVVIDSTPPLQGITRRNGE